MANFRMRNANAALRYTYGGKVHTAYVRISKTNYSYSVTSTESHARLYRAFYPHRRALGNFVVQVDAIGYTEFRAFMNWLRAYANNMFEGQTGDARGALPMEVLMPSRHFHMYGILTEGIDDHDQVGSMVFSPQLKFMTLKDFHDKGTAIVATDQTSQFSEPARSLSTTVTRGKGKHKHTVHIPSSTAVFYPVTASQYRDKDSQIYDGLQETPTPPPGFPSQNPHPPGPLPS